MQIFFLKRFRRKRGIKEKSLAIDTASLEQHLFLRLGFHAFRHATHAAGMANLHQIPHQHLAATVSGQIGNQRPVQLQAAKFHMGQQGNIGVLGAEIVQGKLQSQLMEPVHGI